MGQRSLPLCRLKAAMLLSLTPHRFGTAAHVNQCQGCFLYIPAGGLEAQVWEKIIHYLNVR